MKIVSWNINSINARQEHVQRYLAKTGPDVILMQEIKTPDFPAEAFKTLGYDCAYVGQKAYNGVAVLSKTPLNVLLDHLTGDDTDEQARYLEFETNGLRLINIYLPNGNPLGTEKFTYKLNWMKRLYERLQILREDNIPFAIGGDFNVIPEDQDCHDPAAWAQDALAQPESRAAFRSFLYLGLTDAFRIFDDRPGQFTFWDYQAGAWPKNNGIRIDHFLLSPEITDRAVSCRIDTTPRGWDKPSDHTPIILEIA